MSLDNRTQLLKQAIQNRILILDGGMGTMIQGYRLTEADFRGERFKDWPSDIQGNNDLLVLTRPDVIKAVHMAYLDAGADILETNSFNATRLSQADYGMEEIVYELNVAAAKLARQAADERWRHDGLAEPCRWQGGGVQVFECAGAGADLEQSG